MIDPKELEERRRSLPDHVFRQEYLATFETFAGRIYYAFDRASNTRKYIGTIPDAVYVGMDFNIDPCSACVAVRVIGD